MHNNPFEQARLKSREKPKIIRELYSAIINREPEVEKEAAPKTLVYELVPKKEG